ncbi:MAG: T9SS type A sorting domain-containing protein [Candidatus Cloacimonetes bacterium]|nr:T9SS type A sorting domain-containing protein [Candidatus Cloacimonadota bacterium]
MKKIAIISMVFILFGLSNYAFCEEVEITLLNQGGINGNNYVSDCTIYEGYGTSNPLVTNLEFDNSTTIYVNIDNPTQTVVWAEGYGEPYYSGQEPLYLSSPTYNIDDDLWVDIYLSCGVVPTLFDYTLTAESSDDWNWVSFPVLDPDYVDPLDHVLAPVIDDLVEVQHYQDYIFKDYSGVWQNEIGDFSSIDGYKIKMENERALTVAGEWEDPNTPIPLEAENSNWIGYFLQESHSISDAFAAIWDNISFIRAEDWFYYAPVPDPDTCNSIRGSVNPGELYIVGVNQDCNLVWDNSKPPVTPYTREETDYFTYQEKAEYMPITIDTVIGTVPEEIAAYVDGECVGASKAKNDFPIQILAYTPDAGNKNGTLDFMIYNSQKGGKSTTDYAVYNRKINAYIDETVHYNKDDFVTVRLDTETTSEQQAEFRLLRNYPNPVKNGITHISFASAIEAENTELIIYNIKGQLITSMNCNNAQVGKNGLQTVAWDCTDNSGIKVENGVYFYKLVSNNKQAVRKMIILE